MHFAGSNPATDRKTPKCIYKNSKSIRVEKTGEISRNLPFPRRSDYQTALSAARVYGTDVHNQPKIYIENPAESSHISRTFADLLPL